MFKRFEGKTFLTHLFQCTFEYLLFFPLYLIFAVYNLDRHVAILWLVTILLLYFLGVIYRTMFFIQEWYTYGLIALFIGLATAYAFPGKWFLMTLFTILHTIYFYRGMMYSTQVRQSVLSTAFLWLGGPINYFITFFFFYYLGALKPYLPVFSIAGFVTVTVILFIANNDHLRAATLSREEDPFISRPIKRQNRGFLIATILLIIVVASLDLLRKVFWWILYIFRAIISWALYAGSTVQFDEQQQPSQPERPSIPSVIEGESAPKFIVFLGIVVLYATYALIFIVLIMLILLAIKRTRRSVLWLIRKIIDFLKRLGQRIFMRGEDDAQYTDEKENIFDWEEWRKEQQDRFRGFMKEIFTREPKWDDLTNEERVRFAYRSIVDKRARNFYAPSLTPREILDRMQAAVAGEDKALAQKLRDAYEKTRYGEKTIDDETVQEIYVFLQKSKS